MVKWIEANKNHVYFKLSFLNTKIIFKNKIYFVYRGKYLAIRQRCSFGFFPGKGNGSPVCSFVSLFEYMPFSELVSFFLSEDKER